MSTQTAYPVICWNCMGEYDLIIAGWCSCENKGPTKVCPYCYKCFCDVPEADQKKIWAHAPAEILNELKVKTVERKRKRKSPQEQIVEMFEIPKETYSILIVEDDLGLQRYLKKLVASYFLNPICASDGEEAISIVQQRHIHIVLLDLMIPGLNGFQVCKKLKDEPETKALPIIITTARDDVIDKVKGFVLGVDDYITKPFKSTELMIRVLNLLRKTYL